MKETSPLFEFCGNCNLLEEVVGLGTTEEVSIRIKNVVEKRVD